MNYNHPKMRYVYVGIDCHKSKHTAAVINCFNEKLDIFNFKNNETDFQCLLDMVEKHTSNEVTAIYGLEDTKHLGHALATFLLANNCTVKNVNSTLTYNERRKYPIISKTDEIDALCIAKVTLDNLDVLPTARNDEIYWTLKQIVKMRTAVMKDLIKTKNKLHAQLLHHYPNYNDFFSNFDCRTALELWQAFPSADTLLNLSLEELTEFILKHSKKALGVNRARKIYDLIHNSIYEDLNYQFERNILIQMLVSKIKSAKSEIAQIEENIISLYDKIDCQLHTIIGLSKVTSAEILAEIGNINRFDSSDKLARYAGIAPINFSSGNNDKSIRNEYGNRSLNSYIYNLACRSIVPGKKKDNPYNPIFIEYYYKKIREGKNKQQALTCIMRRLINIIYKMLKNSTEYQMPEELREKYKNEYLTRTKI